MDVEEERFPTQNTNWLEIKLFAQVESLSGLCQSELKGNAAKRVRSGVIWKVCVSSLFFIYVFISLFLLFFFVVFNQNRQSQNYRLSFWWGLDSIIPIMESLYRMWKKRITNQLWSLPVLNQMYQARKKHAIHGCEAGFLWIHSIADNWVGNSSSHVSEGNRRRFNVGHSPSVSQDRGSVPKQSLQGRGFETKANPPLKPLTKSQINFPITTNF